MNKKLVLMGAALLMTAATASAQKRVTGRVLDTDGQPVAGASVRVEGHKGVTVTDANGNFTLQNVPSSATKLRINYIGKKAQTISIAGNVKVVLADNDNELEEAVVVGYGKVKKGDFTGSVAAIKGKDLQKMQSSNVTKSLEGVMPGVQLTSTTGQPGSSANIYLRGIGSINASSEPLIIVDGAPYEGSLNSINPNDIESINVQKDASATSIYGARGSNGIIYITTKKGSTDGKTRVTVDAKWGWNSRGVSKYKTVDNPAQYYEMMWESYYNSNLDKMDDFSARMDASSSLIGSMGGYNVFNVSDYDLINPITGHINPNAQQIIPTNWDDELFHHGLRQEYNVGINGGNERTQYYMSFNYLSDDSYVKKSDFNRMTVCMGYTAKTLRRRAGKRRRKGAGNPCRENGNCHPLASCVQNEHMRRNGRLSTRWGRRNQCGQNVYIDSVRITLNLDLTFCQATVKSGKCCFSVLTK